MPFPKLSAVLNNCPLHALSPEIKTEVLRYAADTDYSNIQDEGYQSLKNCFAQFYGFNPAVFSWVDFGKILDSYNAFDTQIILGPVLRSFMKESMYKEEMVGLIAAADNKPVEELITQFTEIDPNNGRYYSLAPDELYSYVAKHLGFNLTYHPQVGPSVDLKADGSIATIDLFHQGGIGGAQVGGHWERTFNGAESDNVQIQESTQLNHIIPLLGQDPAVNSFGIAYLKKHVNIKLRAFSEGLDLGNELQELVNTTGQIEDYLFNITVVPKKLALDLMQKPLTRDALYFIEQHHFMPVLENRIYEQYILASDDGKPMIGDHEVKIISRLLKYPEAIEEIKEIQKKQQMALEEQFNCDNAKEQSSSLVYNVVLEHSKVNLMKPDVIQVRPTNPEVDTTEPPIESENTSESKEKMDNPLRILSAQEQLFNDQLKVLKKKVEALDRDKREPYKTTFKVAEQLCNNLTDEGARYFAGEQTQSRYNVFNEECTKHINSARPVLETHRGWKELLGNIAAAIVGLGIFYVAAIVINKAVNHKFLFFKTDSEEKIDLMKKRIDQIAPH